MGRFEKRPDNEPRVRGELSRAAETALWAVVEDLENLQQNVLRSLQDEIKKLQTEKERLTDEVRQLIDEKEHLQEVRRITEQQVLIRQLSEALAKHICSQLQASLAKISSQTESQISALKSAQNMIPASENNQQVERMLGTLDDNLTVAFNSLQQELKNYQSDLSQQMSRMYSQQRQGETIVEELIDHLRRELTKAIAQTSPSAVKSSPPTVLQPSEPAPQITTSAVNVSPPTVLQLPDKPAEVVPTPPPVAETTTSKQSTTILPEKSPSSNTQLPPVVPPIQESKTELKTGIPKFTSESDTKLPPSPVKASDTKLPPPPVKASDTKLPPPPVKASDTKLPPPPVKAGEPISVLNQDLATEAAKSPPIQEKTTEVVATNKTSSPPAKATEPISVISKDLLETKNPAPPPTPISRQGSTSSSSRSRRSTSLSPIQIGFLLVVLSAVMSSLYNVAIKGMFYKTSQLSTVSEVAGLISPSLGNIMLILTLRLMVVVPLMILLAPIMYPQVWEDLQNFKNSFGRNQPATSPSPLRVLQLMLASGCLLFLSQVLIYLALGQMATGTAIALFFVYPVISGLLSWLLFRDRPGAFRASAIGSIFCGELLVFTDATSIGVNNPIGAATAILAGVAFACYIMLTRVCATKVHPVSLTLINFVTMLALSFVFLMLPLPENWSLAVDPSKLLEIVLSAFILGVLTLLSYVFNHIGIGKLGALRSAIIGAGVPILTVIFAGLLLQETLNIVQIMGVLFITFGVAAFSVGKVQNSHKPSSAES
ncbi:DMT family transporter [Nostoc sp. TCL26-01]|uniref:DMT family transporter n=1 Tax=Nostoc sp. TCL26-01 TaxID=2576904 RepID=UPI0015BA6964|nr:DMT family transporter [Nostoc sp. TCL26-01]QLE56666.1 hypothetical protein FD725_14840 [Nostoc sp. TCL26-01]